MKTDQRIVRAMAELLRMQGYAATGLQQLARAAQAPIGSIYHHFRGGKREVAAAALRQAGAAYIQLLPLLLDQDADLPAAIDAAFGAAADDMANTGWANMCPVGTVAGEIADTEPELRLVAAEVIASWVDEGSRYLTGRGLSETDARAAMYALLTALEGGFLLARAQRAVEPLLAAGRAVSAYVATMPVTAQVPESPNRTFRTGRLPGSKTPVRTSLAGQYVAIARFARVQAGKGPGRLLSVGPPPTIGLALGAPPPARAASGPGRARASSGTNYLNQGKPPR